MLSWGIKLGERLGNFPTNLTLTALFRSFMYFILNLHRQEYEKRRSQNNCVELSRSLITVMLLRGLWQIRDVRICSYGHVIWMPDELDVVLLRGRAAYVSTTGPCPTPQSEDVGQTCMNCKKGLFPPGFSSRAWQSSQPASLILPPGQSLASSPDGSEQRGELGD